MNVPKDDSPTFFQKIGTRISEAIAKIEDEKIQPAMELATN